MQQARNLADAFSLEVLRTVKYYRYRDRYELSFFWQTLWFAIGMTLWGLMFHGAKEADIVSGLKWQLMCYPIFYSLVYLFFWYRKIKNIPQAAILNTGTPYVFQIVSIFVYGVFLVLYSNRDQNNYIKYAIMGQVVYHSIPYLYRLRAWLIIDCSSVSRDDLDRVAVATLEIMLEHRRIEPTGMSRHEIEQLNSVQYNPTTYKETECVICMEDYELGDELRILPCDHYSHKQCMDTWLATQSSCPLCRASAKREPA